jgi:hypothetical protein
MTAHQDASHGHGGRRPKASSEGTRERFGVRVTRVLWGLYERGTVKPDLSALFTFIPEEDQMVRTQECHSASGMARDGKCRRDITPLPASENPMQHCFYPRPSDHTMSAA